MILMFPRDEYFSHTTENAADPAPASVPPMMPLRTVVVLLLLGILQAAEVAEEEDTMPLLLPLLLKRRANFSFVD